MLNIILVILVINSSDKIVGVEYEENEKEEEGCTDVDY